MIDFAVPRMSTTQQPTICSVAKMCPFQSSLPLLSSTLFCEALRAHVVNFEMRRRHHDVRTSTVTRSDSRHWCSICVRVCEVCLCVCSLSILVTRLGGRLQLFVSIVATRHMGRDIKIITSINESGVVIGVVHGQTIERGECVALSKEQGL